MTKKLQDTEYITRIQELVGKEYSVLDRYVDTRTKLLTRHNICGYEWKISPNKFLMGRRCPICSRKTVGEKQRTSYKELCEQISSINDGEFSLISKEYYGNKSKIIVFHNLCKRSFKIIASNFLIRKKCQRCVKEQQIKNTKKSQKVFCQEIKDKYGDEYSVMGIYISTKKKILMRHNKCEKEWNVSPNNILRGYGCPRCNSSKGEKEIIKSLDNLQIKYFFQHKFANCKRKNTLPFDFYLPDYNLCIEYDGELHYMLHQYIPKEKAICVFNNTIINDKIKTIYCLENNISLLRIPYWENKNINKILEEVLFFHI
jgi:hypothetical protein